VCGSATHTVSNILKNSRQGRLKPSNTNQTTFIKEKTTMPKITVLPHAVLCPEGAVIENAPEGQTVLDVLLDHDIEVDHACEKSCACTTCHVIIRKGFDSMEEPTELEEDLLDQAWGLEADSRLSCQAVVADEDLVVEIPKYTINHAREDH
jgi:ferredoxin, 2Fe-2S type, ISC system